MSGSVRLARIADVPRLVEMARALHYAARQPWTFDPARAGLFARHLIGAAEGFVVVLDDGEGRAVGTLAANFGDHPMGAGLYGMEWVFWLEPQARGGPGAFRLIDAYEAEARQRGCAFIGMANLAGATVDRQSDGVSRLYQRRGFVPREQHFLKAL